jgi:glycosyltransferase involved in cell wall biosynthesis
MTGAFGGSSRSLAEAVRGFPEKVEAHFLTPRGTVEPRFAALGDVLSVSGLSQFDNTQYSHYRGWRWLVMLRELWHLPATFRSIRKARRKWRNIDVIHVNEFTGILPMWLARRAFRVPVVVHARSVSRLDQGARRSRFVANMLRQHAAQVIAIDETVRASLPEDLPVTVIHNAFTPKAEGAADPAVVAAEQAARPGALRLGFVGNLLRVKGIEDLVEAAARVKAQSGDVQYFVYGDDARTSRSLRARVLELFGLNQNIKAQVLDKIKDLGLEQDFHMAGFVGDVAQVYRQMDVLCFPSHFNAPGRPVFEAAFFGVPSIVAVTDPTPDTLVPGETGLAVPPHQPDDLARAILACAEDRDRTRAMGEKARALAERNFSVERNAVALYEVLRSVSARTVASGKEENV